MPKHTKWTAVARAKFLAALEREGTVYHAAKKVHMSRARAYVLRANDPAFARAWDEAEAVATDALEREARRRGLDGWDEPVYQRGELVGTIRRYSDKMLEMMLRAKRPREFAQFVRQEQVDAEGNTINVVAVLDRLTKLATQYKAQNPAIVESTASELPSGHSNQLAP